MRHKAMIPTIDVMCAPCLRRGRRRRLATFDLGPDGPAVTAWTQDGRKVVPLWTGPGERTVHLGPCGCGHQPQRRREWIMAALESEQVRELAAAGKRATIPL